VNNPQSIGSLYNTPRTRESRRGSQDVAWPQRTALVVDVPLVGTSAGALEVVVGAGGAIEADGPRVRAQVGNRGDIRVPCTIQDIGWVSTHGHRAGSVQSQTAADPGLTGEEHSPP
jgi:hypothetical protein